MLTLHGTGSGSFLTPDHTTTTMTSTNSNLYNNNVSILAAGTSGSAFPNFGVYRQTPVGLSELLIRMLFPNPISVEPYHIAFIAKLFFRQILSLSDSPSVSFNDIMATVASYFDINTGSTERETETTVQSISCYFFSGFESDRCHFFRIFWKNN